MNKVPSKESALGWENQAAITAEGPVLEIEIIKPGNSIDSKSSDHSE